MPDGTSVGNVYLDLVVRDTLTKQLQTMAQQAQSAMQMALALEPLTCMQKMNMAIMSNCVLESILWGLRSWKAKTYRHTKNIELTAIVVEPPQDVVLLNYKYLGDEINP